jgi:hypothetical protein
MQGLALLIPALFTVLNVTIPVTAQPQTVYRCGTHYSQTPCEGAIAVKADDARSAAQKVESEKVIERDGRTANAMEKARLKEEKERAAYDAKLRKADDDAAKKALAAQQKTTKTAITPKKSASAPKDGKSSAEPFIAKSSTSSK